MKPPFSYVLALPAAIGWAAGILLWWAGAAWWCPVLSAVAGILLILRGYRYVATGLYSAAAAWIVALANTPAEPPVGIFDGEERSYHAEVVQVKNSARMLTMLLRIDSVGPQAVPPFVVRTASLPEWIPPRIGSTVRFTTVLEPLDRTGRYSFRPDYSLNDLRNHTVAQAYVEGDSIKITGHNPGLNAWMADRRMSLVSTLAHTGLNDTAYGLLCALITGYGDDLDADIREDFRATGIAHALALSGFHVGIIVMIVSLLIFPLNVWPKLRPWRYVLILAILWLYAEVVGMSESVIRASVMFSALAVCRIAGRRPNGYNALCIAVLVILAIRPYSLFAPGFQLSVCAVLGIIAFNARLNPINRRNHKAYMAMQYVTVPVSATIGTIPIIIFYFHKLPLLFIASNLLVTLLLPLLMVCGTTIILLSVCGLGCGWICATANWIVHILSDATSALAGLPMAQMPVYLNGLQCMVLATAIASTGISVYINRKRDKGIVLCIALACAAALPLAGEKTPCEEAFIVPTYGNTPIVMRTGSKAIVRFTCHHDRIDAAKARLDRELEHYIGATGIDTIIITTHNSAIGPYTIAGDVLSYGQRRIAILCGSHGTDSLSMRAGVALICARFRGSAADALRLTGADTLLLSRDLSLKRALRIAAESPVPTIDLRKQTYTL